MEVTAFFNLIDRDSFTVDNLHPFGAYTDGLFEWCRRYAPWDLNQGRGAIPHTIYDEIERVLYEESY